MSRNVRVTCPAPPWVMKAPPLLPFFNSTIPAISSVRMASRNAVRLTSSISESSRSDGRRSPAFSSPLTSFSRIESQISSKILRVLTGRNVRPADRISLRSPADAAGALSARFRPVRAIDLDRCCGMSRLWVVRPSSAAARLFARVSAGRSDGNVETAVDRDVLAGDVAGRVREQEAHRLHHFLGLRPASHRDAGEYAFAELVAADGFGHGRFDHTKTDGIGPYPELRPFLGRR